MTVFVTSDLHFNHRNIIEFCNRPFPDVDAMNQALVEGWNLNVTESDEVYVVGDFAFVNTYGWPLHEIWLALKGIKHLIVGNHDEHNKKVLQLPWASMSHYRKITTVYNGEKRRAILSHYPMETWDEAPKGSIMLHGHSHGSMKRLIAHRYDVGVDTARFGFDPYPWMLDDLFLRASHEVFDPQDHHGN